MSILSQLIGKIPVVGGAINKVGKVLPSGGQLIGGLAGPIGGVIGGSLDGNTTPLQKKVQGATMAAAGGLGLGGLAGLPLGGLSGGATSGLAGTALDFLKNHGGQALDLGLGTAGMVNAAQLGKKSSDYATSAVDRSRANWDSREPLRLAGVEGMLRPQPTTDVNTIGTRARATNPFASKALPLPVKL